MVSCKIALPTPMGWKKSSLGAICSGNPTDQVIEECLVPKSQIKKNMVVNFEGARHGQIHVMRSRWENCQIGRSKAVPQHLKLHNVKKSFEEKETGKYMVSNAKKPLTEAEIHFLRKYGALKDDQYVRTDIMSICKNLWKIGGQFEEFIRSCFPVSADKDLMLEDIEVWREKYDKMLNCVGNYKWVIKFATGIILVGSACVVIVMPTMLPVVFGIATITKTMEVWLTTLCKTKQKGIAQKKEKILQVKEEVVEAKLDAKLKEFVDDFKKFKESIAKLAARTRPVEIDARGVSKDLAKAVKRYQVLKIREVELRSIIVKVAVCARDVAPYLTE